MLKCQMLWKGGPSSYTKTIIFYCKGCVEKLIYYRVNVNMVLFSYIKIFSIGAKKVADIISYENFRTFWEEDPIVVIDSCSILDLYRYAPHTSKGILKNFEEIQDNLWIPGHVLEEYNENKKDVIAGAHRKYNNVSKEVLSIIEKAENDISTKFIRYGKFRYPQIRTFKDELEKVTTELKEKAKGFEKIVSTEIKENKLILEDDQVNTFLQKLNEQEQIGAPFALPKKIEIYKDGEFRYKHLIPPGYKDIIKDKNDITNTKKYGDLIIWKEILQQASEFNRPFIFITDDEKEDWWDLKVTTNHLGAKVELIGPRAELVSEFNDLSQYGENGFLMLTLPEFNKHISIINDVNKKEAHQSYVELSTEEVVMKIIEHKVWEDIIDKDELTSSFIHDGELASFMDGILKDVEIEGISNPDFVDLYVDIDEEEVLIEGTFSCIVYANIETALSAEYAERGSASIILTGNIAIELKLDYSKTEEFMEIDNSIVKVSGIEIFECNYQDNNDYSDIACISCNVYPGIHFTNGGEPVCKNCLLEFDSCSSCGFLYEYGSLGGYICQECQIQ